MRVHDLIFAFGLCQALVHLEILIQHSILAISGQSIEQQHVKSGKSDHSVHLWCQARLPKLNGLVHVNCPSTIRRTQYLICLLVSVEIFQSVVLEQIHISVPHHLEVDSFVVRHRITPRIVSPADFRHIVGLDAYVGSCNTVCIGFLAASNTSEDIVLADVVSDFIFLVADTMTHGSGASQSDLVRIVDDHV